MSAPADSQPNKGVSSSHSFNVLQDDENGGTGKYVDSGKLDQSSSQQSESQASLIYKDEGHH